MVCESKKNSALNIELFLSKKIKIDLKNPDLNPIENIWLVNKTLS